MSQNSTEFADNIQELYIQKEQLESWKKVINSHPTIASELKYVLIFHKKLSDLKAELQNIIDAPDGAHTNPIRNIELLNVDLPKTKSDLEECKNDVIKAFFDCHIELEDLDFLFLEYLQYDEDSENDIYSSSFDVNIALNENITRLEENISIMTALEQKAKRKWYQFWK